MVIKKKIISVDSNSNNTLFALRVNCDEFSFIELLQHELTIELQIQPPREYELSSGITTIHSLYEGYDTIRKLSIQLIANKTNKGYLIDFMDSIDYFVQIATIQTSLEQIHQTLLSLQSVLFIQKIEKQNYTIKQQKYIAHLFI
jgi:hypothetical protein